MKINGIKEKIEECENELTELTNQDLDLDTNRIVWNSIRHLREAISNLENIEEIE